MLGLAKHVRVKLVLPSRTAMIWREEHATSLTIYWAGGGIAGGIGERLGLPNILLFEVSLLPPHWYKRPSTNMKNKIARQTFWKAYPQ